MSKEEFDQLLEDFDADDEADTLQEYLGMTDEEYKMWEEKRLNYNG